MDKTTATLNQDLPKTQSAETGKQQRNPVRYLFAVIPFVLVLLISTSYQQNHHDVNYFEKKDFAPEVKDSLRQFLKTITLKEIPFCAGNAEWEYLKSFYHLNGFRPVWIHLKGLDDGAHQLIRIIERAREFGLEPENYHYSTIKKLVNNFQTRSTSGNKVIMDFNIEILLSDAVFRMMSNLQSGYVPYDSVFATANANDYSGILLKGISDSDIMQCLLSVEPQFIEYRNLRHALKGFLAQNPLNAQDSISTENLFRYRKIALNLDRLRKKQFSGNRMLYVNIPAYSLSIFEQNMIADTFRVIVGSPASPTPLISSRMETIIANPVWYVPRSIAIDEILPKIKNDSNYLEKNGFSMLDRNFRTVDSRAIVMEDISADNFDYTFKQKRGADNSLGKAKFMFSNPYSVYLHDTPSKLLFSKDQRAFSHGCIRVEHPERLANYLLSLVNSDTTKFESLMQAGIEHEIALNSPMAIHITYITCKADRDGTISFFNDIYNMDEIELKELAYFINAQ